MKSYISFILLVVVSFSSCKKEEDTTEPLRDVGEQYVADDLAINTYLNSHTYNYADFASDSTLSLEDIKIDTLAGDNIGMKSLKELSTSKTIKVPLNDGRVVDHKLYYLEVREGMGEQPSKADSTYVTYKGELLNGRVFDQRIAPIWMDLTGVIRGFREGMPYFKTGTYTVNEDNTVDFSGFGMGIIFLPSGIGYFSQANGSIPAYSPLIFKIGLYTYKITDHDGDGIPSSLEYDPDEDGVLNDTDGDGTPDYADKDS